MKRSFKAQVTGGIVPALFRGWNEWDAGDYVEGELHSMYETLYNKQVQYNWRVKVTDCNFKVLDKKTGKMISPIGELLVLNSAGQLNKMLQQAEFGWGVFVQYGGKVKSKDPTDKQMYHSFQSLESGPLDGASEEDDSDTSGL